MGNTNLRNAKSIILISGIALSLTAFQNCSDVSFDQGSSSSASQAPGDSGGTLGQPGGPGDDAGGNVGQPGDPNNPGGGTNPPGGGTNPPGGSNPLNPPGGTTPPGGTVAPGTPPAAAGIIPKVVFIGPPCIRGTNCVAYLELDQPYAQTVDFIWYTNDTAYLTPSTPIYGQPNVHYVPVLRTQNLHVTFPPGTVRKEIYVQNINPFNIPILIALRFSECNYGGVGHNCSSFFRP